MLYIGVDLGTSAVKLLLMDEKGAIRNIVSEEYPISFPHPGWSEQNPEDWLKAVLKGIGELTANEDKSQIAGIGAGGQMHGLVVLDKDDHVLRPAILWNDGRTQEETDYLNNVIGKKKLTELTGNIAFTGFTAPKILWMKKHEPDLFARIDKIMLPKDYINYMLTGTNCTDYSDASGMLLLDVKNKCWSREMLEICGIREDMMPKLYESYETVGTLKPEYAKLLGLPKTGNALHAFAHADGGFHLMGCMLSAASCNKWWMDEIIRTKDYPKEQAGISDDMLGRNHIYFLPYLMGERAPHNDASARGCFIGLTMDSTREDMTQAVLEGVAFGIRDSLEAAKKLGIHVEKSMICGGGAKSPLWKKIFANVLGITLTIPETEQGPGYGGAILAAVACGEFASVKDATDKLVRVTDTVEPDPELTARYEEKYKVFHSLYPALKPLFPTL